MNNDPRIEEVIDLPDRSLATAVQRIADLQAENRQLRAENKLLRGGLSICSPMALRPDPA